MRAAAVFWPEYLNRSYLIIEEFQLTLDGKGDAGESLCDKPHVLISNSLSVFKWSTILFVISLLNYGLKRKYNFM